MIKKLLRVAVFANIWYIILSLLWVGLEYTLDNTVTTSHADSIVCAILSLYMSHQTIHTIKSHVIRK